MVKHMLFVLYFFFLFRLGIDLFFNVVHAFLELRYAFAEAAHKFGNLLATKEEQDNKGNDNDFLAAQRAEE